MSQEKTKKKITLGGQAYDPEYTFLAYVKMHEEHGVNVFDLQTTPKTVAVLVWGALLKTAPTLTVEEVTKKMTLKEAMQNNRICIDLVLEGIRDAKKQEAETDATAPANPA